MSAVSRSIYPGAVIFGGAAVAAALAAMVIHGVPHSDRSLSEVLSIRSSFSLAAGISAAIAFALIRRFDWRLRRVPLLGRALVLGFLTVAVGHLLIGLVYGFLLLAVNLVSSDPPTWVRGDLLFGAIGMSVYSAAFGWYLTLPLGVAAAALVEWLERRQERSLRPEA